MSDLDKIFVASVVKNGVDAIHAAIAKGVDDTYLTGEGLKAWKFLRDYTKKYNDVPVYELIEGNTGVALIDPPPAPVDFYIDELINRRLYNEMGKHLHDIVEWYKNNEVQAAYEAYEAGLRELRKLGIAQAKTVSLLAQGPKFLEHYDKLKAGFRGILTPWPTMNEATLGFWPEDLVLFVARLGIGKTFSLVLIANHAWQVQKKRVLFITTEMSQEKIYQRWIAVNQKYPYKELTHARLSAFAEQKMRDWVEATREEEGLYIVGGDFDFKLESLECAIEESQPDVVFVDGAYLLKVAGDGRIERAANSYDELKRMAKRYHLPLVASTQFNRQVKANKTSSAGSDKIALSDAAGWNSDLIYGLVRTKDMIRDKRLLLLQLKYREGEGEDIELIWDFETMTFEELPKGAQAAMAHPGAVPPMGSGSVPPQSTPKASAPDPYGTGSLFGGDDDDSVPF